MDISTPFIANHQSSHLVVPSVRSLYNPAMLAQSILRFRPTPCNSVLDTALSALDSATPEIIRLVGVQLLRSEAWPTTAARMNWRDDVEQVAEHARVVHVRSGELYSERNSLGIDHNMALRARFSFIRRIRPNLGSPFFWFFTEFRESGVTAVSFGYMLSVANFAGGVRWHTKRSRCYLVAGKGLS
jgi:hypothetical protein